MPRLNRADLRPTGAGVEARRDEILDAAARLFSSRGYHATTIDDVAEAAGVAKGTVYWYYRSKKALFLDVLDRAAAAFRDELGRRTGRSTSALHRLEAGLRATFALARARPELWRLYFQQVHDADEEFVRERARIYERIRTDLRQTLDQAMAAGELPRGDAELLSRMVTGAVEAATGYAVERPRQGDVVETAAGFVLGGLGGMRDE